MGEMAEAKRLSAYERARRRATTSALPTREDISYSTTWAAKRIAYRLPVSLQEVLEGEGAPLHVLRWIACGETPGERMLRGEVILAVRRKIQRPGGGWPYDIEKTAVLDAYRTAPEVLRARQRREAVPTPDDLDAATYEIAMDRVRKERSTRRRRVAQVPQGLLLTKKQAEALRVLAPVIGQLAR